MKNNAHEATNITGSDHLLEGSFLTTQIITHKLDADEYSAEDLEGVTESLFGSGNLNYLLLQAQQSYETQDLQSLGSAEFAEGNVLATSASHANNASAEGHTGPFIAQNSLAQNIGAQAPGSAHQQTSANTGTAAGNTSFSLASIGSAAAEENATVSTGNVNNTETTFFQPPPDDGPGDDGGGDPPDPETPNGEPFLDLDTDLDLGPVGGVVDQVGDVVDGTLGDVGTILTGGVDSLPNNALDTVENLLEGGQGLIDTVQDVAGNTVDAATTFLEGVSITDPLSNLDGVQQALADILGTNTLGLSLDIRDILELDTGLTLGDGTLPNLEVSLSPEILGLDPINLSTNELLEDTGLADIIDGTGDLLEGALTSSALSPLTAPVESLVGDVTQDVSDVVTHVADTADTLIDTTQDVVDHVADAVTEPLGHVADSLEDALSPVQDTLADIIEPVVDLASDTLDGATDALDGLLGSGDDGDTDLVVDVGLELGDLDLGIDQDIGLDPVEAIIGDVDIDLLTDVDSGGISDLDLTVDGDLFDSAEFEAVIGDLSDAAEPVSDLLSETVAGAEEAIGDLLPGDGPTLEESALGDVADILPDPIGSTDEGLAGLLNDQSDGGGGLGGLLF